MTAWRQPYARARDHLPVGPIETERLILRPVEGVDCLSFFDMDADPRVADAVPIPRVKDRETYFANFATGYADGRFAHFRSLVLKDGPAKCIGWVFLRPTEDGVWVELGYRLAHAYWGRGYVPEASAALIELGFAKLGLDRVMALAVPENRNSKRVMEKLGFAYCETTEDSGYVVERFVLEKDTTTAD